MLTASTSNWSEIRLPIIRAYLGCKHRSSSNQFAPTLSALRSSSDRHSEEEKKAKTGTSLKSSVFRRINPQRGSVTTYTHTHTHTYEILFPLSFTISNTGISVGNSERYRRLASGHSNLSPCRLGETTSFSTAHFLLACRPSFAIRKIGGCYVYE